MPLPVDRPKAGSVVKREESSRLVAEVHMLSLAMDNVGDNWPPLFYILAQMNTKSVWSCQELTLYLSISIFLVHLHFLVVDTSVAHRHVRLG
jgi:hypothetical protein